MKLYMCYDFDSNDEECVVCDHRKPHKPVKSWFEGEKTCCEDWYCHLPNKPKIYCKPMKKEKSIFKKDIQRILDI